MTELVPLLRGEADELEMQLLSSARQDAPSPEARARTLAALGYHECVTYSFIDADSATRFGGGEDALKLENPISSEMTHMRPDLLPGLLQAAARNQARGHADMALFELGPVFAGGEPGEQAIHAVEHFDVAPRGVRIPGDQQGVTQSDVD